MNGVAAGGGPVVAGAAVAVVGDGALKRPDWLHAAKARRLDPLAAVICAAVGRLGGVWRPDAAVVVGSAWGCTASTVAFAESLRQYGERGGSPAAFTASVHHHPCGSLGEMLGLHGPAATVCLEGASGLAALRWAWIQIATGRAPEALVVAADAPDPWTRAVVARHGRSPHPVGGGAVALRLTAAGPGRRCGFAFRAVGPLCDGGGGDPAQEARFAAAAGPSRRSAPAQHGAWWPTAALAAAPWDDPVAFTVVEETGLHQLAAWFDPPSSM